MERPVPFISRVRLRNYKSIPRCNVSLGALTVLVGPNGSGKSNFLQALALLARAVETTPYEAITELGGVGELVRRAPEPAESFSIDVQATVPWGAKREQWAKAKYGFEIGAARRHGLRPFEVLRETCELRWAGQVWRFNVKRGAVDDPSLKRPTSRIEPDRLYLPLASIQSTFGPLFGHLTNMQFYNFALDSLREPARPSEGAILGHRGEHLADVLAAVAAVEPQRKDRIDAYLRAIAPGIEGVDHYSLGDYVTVAFRANIGAHMTKNLFADDEMVQFGPTSISDGTIRAAGLLAALFQLAAVDGRIPLIGIEEPEIALHPAAAGVLFDALTEASEQVQVLVTTQSPDLLDRVDPSVIAVRAVSMEDGRTVIGEVDRASRQIVKGKLYTLGELMRGNQLSPEPAPHRRATEPEA
jgi:predicted ATPase